MVYCERSSICLQIDLVLLMDGYTGLYWQLEIIIAGFLADYALCAAADDDIMRLRLSLHVLS